MKKTLLTVMAVILVILALGSQAARASTSPGLSDKRAALLKLHNDARKAKCGADSLRQGPNIEDAALYHADDMADENYFSHNSQNPYVYWADRIDRYIDREVGGENIARGYSTATGAFNGWMDSDSHRRNIMDCSFKWVGFGYAYNSSAAYDHYWVADFSY